MLSWMIPWSERNVRLGTPDNLRPPKNDAMDLFRKYGQLYFEENEWFRGVVDAKRKFIIPSETAMKAQISFGDCSVSLNEVLTIDHSIIHKQEKDKFEQSFYPVPWSEEEASKVLDDVKRYPEALEAVLKIFDLTGIKGDTITKGIQLYKRRPSFFLVAEIPHEFEVSETTGNVDPNEHLNRIHGNAGEIISTELSDLSNRGFRPSIYPLSAYIKKTDSVPEGLTEVRNITAFRKIKGVNPKYKEIFKSYFEKKREEHK